MEFRTEGSQGRGWSWASGSWRRASGVKGEREDVEFRGLGFRGETKRKRLIEVITMMWQMGLVITDKKKVVMMLMMIRPS